MLDSGKAEKIDVDGYGEGWPEKNVDYYLRLWHSNGGLQSMVVACSLRLQQHQPIRSESKIKV